MGRDELTFDEEGSRETQGPVQVASMFVADPMPATDPSSGTSSHFSGECLAGLSAPTGLFFAEHGEELRGRFRTGDRHGGVEVMTSPR